MHVHRFLCLCLCLCLGLGLSSLGCQTAASPSPRGGEAPLATASPMDRLPRAAEVREVVQVRGYTYLRLRLAPDAAPEADVWAVSFSAPVAVGQNITVRPFAERTAFPSRQLGRTFDRLWFVTFSLHTEDITG